MLLNENKKAKNHFAIILLSCIDPVYQSNCLTIYSMTHPLQQREKVWSLAAWDVDFPWHFSQDACTYTTLNLTLPLYIRVDMSADFDSLLWPVFLLSIRKKSSRTDVLSNFCFPSSFALLLSQFSSMTIIMMALF